MIDLPYLKITQEKTGVKQNGYELRLINVRTNASKERTFDVLVPMADNQDALNCLYSKVFNEVEKITYFQDLIHMKKRRRIKLSDVSKISMNEKEITVIYLDGKKEVFKKKECTYILGPSANKLKNRKANNAVSTEKELTRKIVEFLVSNEVCKRLDTGDIKAAEKSFGAA